MANMTSAEKNEGKKNNIVEEGKIYAVMGYISICCIIPLLLKKDNKFALFHAKQGLVIFIGEMGAFIVNIIPVLGQLVWVLAILVFGMLSLAGIVQALMGNYWKMPVIADIAEKISI